MRNSTILRPDRRGFLSGLAAAGIVASGRPAFAQGSGPITWWDHFSPLAPLLESLWSEDGAEVEHSVMNPADMMQSLQLAFRSEEAPDVMSMPTSLAVISQVQNNGWFAPIGDQVTLDKPFQQEVLFDGLTNWGGELYSFPIFSFRWHTSALWYMKDAAEAAGYDGAPGKDWEAIRDFARATTEGSTYGLLLPLQFTGRMEDMVVNLSQMIGGKGEIDWATGDYNFTSPEFAETIAQLLAFQSDGSLHPASGSLDARQGRTRWASGEAVMFFDGPWNSGVLANSMSDVLPMVDVVANPIGNGSVHQGPAPGTFFVSAQSDQQEAAAALLSLLTTDEFYVALAERMDQPPLNLDAVAQADVDPTYTKVIDGFAKSVRLAPEPVIRNPDIGRVYAEMRDVTPTLGEIVQGAFAGAFDDPAPMLQQYNDQIMAERDRAIEKVNSEGGSVSVDDWVFDSWTPGEDFTADRY
ncbi:extracellular solute-binding protein [Pelagovum pacificum]|uniref:sn-glycerol-3-phosphate-binding periplasmic protein UgpB n=1 Tax=Pelagovum pacificum TaxID=2588711 RepID=A0A5C5GHR8_9RHOB|nr:extracellular solute-binding protein [Pelagovum pacificum]QQA43872.1 extracellular solute-binding protein [Pelagovum pacificum]TNY32996.1 extracellular solute-binding protein [Pelagovum pacificum]